MVKEGNFHFGIDKWHFTVPVEMIEGMLAQGEGFRFIRTLEGSLHDIEKLEGHHEFDRDSIRILQLAWLFRNRKIDYAFMDGQKKMLALQISQEMRQ